MPTLSILFLLAALAQPVGNIMQSDSGDRPYYMDSSMLAHGKLPNPQLLADTGFVRYTSLMVRLLDNDTTIDFARMRFWFTQTSKYDPFCLTDGNKLNFYRDSMYAAYKTKDWIVVKGFAEKIMIRELCDIDAQSLAATANLQLGDTVIGRFHGWIARRLLESIKRSGDGESLETSYRLISVSEERPFLAYLGYDKSDAELTQSDGRSFERVTARKIDSGKKAEFWFDVTLPYLNLDQIPDSIKQAHSRANSK